MDNKQIEPDSRPLLWSVFIGLITLSFLNQGPRKETMSLITSEDGFDVFENEQLCWSLSSKEIVGVFAFKRDLFTVDQICFGFQTIHRSDVLWCIHEDMIGYRDSFEHELTQLTDGAWPDRFKDVAHPAFETCWTELWKADNAVQLDEDPYFVWSSPPDCLTD